MSQKTLKQLHNEAVAIHGEKSVKDSLRAHYKLLLKLPAVVAEVIQHLNVRSKSRFSPKSKEAVSHIKARLAEGYTVEDFKKVNNIMCDRWLNTPEWSKYLRPSTLYNSEKFGGYLAEALRQEEQIKAEKAEEQRKKTAELAKENKAVREELKPWYAFPSYGAFRDYVAGMNEKEYDKYPMPQKLVEMQAQWFLAKMKDPQAPVKFSYAYRKLKEEHGKQ